MSMDDDIIPDDLLNASLALSNFNQKYFVYFDQDSGDILAVTNELNPQRKNFLEFDLSDVSDFLNGFKSINKFKISFVNQEKPSIVSKYADDVISPNSLIHVPVVDNWKNIFTIENHLYHKQWVFQVRDDHKSLLQPFNLDYTINFYVVGSKSDNVLIRHVPLKMKNLILNEKYIVEHQTPFESKPDKIKIFVRKFFTSNGLIIL